MLDFLRDVARLFGFSAPVNTVEGALAPLREVQANLQTVVERRNEEARWKWAESARLDEEAYNAEAESKQASDVAARLTDLIG